MARSAVNSNAILDPSILPPGRHSDGAGLYLYVTKAGRRIWQFRASPYVGAPVKNFEIGEFPDLSPNKARVKVEDLREAMAEGEELLVLLGLRREAGAPLNTLEDFVRARHANLSDDLTDRHKRAWITQLEQNILPKLGDRPIGRITGAELAAVIKPVWTTKNATARRILTQLRGVWKMAMRSQAAAMKEGNVADGVEYLLPDVRKKVEHHAALPVDQIADFYGEVAAMGDTASTLCLRFLILTAVRSNEARGALWSEIDLDARVWTIPASRMKAKREHKVPLTDEALKILAAARDLPASGGDLVFPSPRSGKELSVPALLKLIKNAAEAAEKQEEWAVTVHGFRSTFRHWSSEVGEDDRQAEMFIAHAVWTSATEAAYKRDARDLDAARGLADRWADAVITHS